MILIFITSGLFLGWTLGANDAANVFGSAVGSRMVSFTKAAIIASIFVVAGAVLQGSGASQTLGKLGAVNAIGGSFTVALAAAATVYWMTRLSIPVSTTQAIVGAIIGWNIFTDNATDLTSLTQIVTTWISGPILGALFAIGLFALLRFVKRKAGLHLVLYESYLRTGLLIVGAFGSFSLGANNIANVMGVFVPSVHLKTISLGFITITGPQQLFLVGGIAIALGIITYSKKVMETVGNNLFALTSDAALVVVLAQALVLFIFSSATLSRWTTAIGLPPIPLVPVSSSQVIVGAILGIGLYKGTRNINFKVLGTIASGWITTPVVSGLISFFSLFLMQNVFNIDIGTTVEGGPGNGLKLVRSDDINTEFRYGIILFLIIITALIISLILNDRRKSTMAQSNRVEW